jgi:hypothetical protein
MLNSFPTSLTDLAPGDQSSASFDWTGFEVSRIESVKDPRFNQVYEELWKEFGAKGEVEQREVLESRFSWSPAKSDAGYSFGYEMISVFKRSQFVAVRDHTSILCHHHPSEAVVHLSHALIDSSYRGTGIAGWLRAWPILNARACLEMAGLDSRSPITLVAEMDPYDPKREGAIARSKSYQKAGFLMVDPSRFDYWQPDFRPFELIDRDGGPKPLSLRLVIRRVGRESENEISGAELKRIVSALYTMYETGFRPSDMAVVWKHMQSTCPRDQEIIPLIKPMKEVL